MVCAVRFRLSAIWQSKFSGVVLALLASACGSTSSESVVGPGGPKCSVTLTAPADPLDAGGGAGTVSVNTTPECEWTASAEAGWITDLTPAQGQGGGQVQFLATPNPSGVGREGAININGQRATVRQSAAACTLSVSVSTSEFAASGGTGTITIAGPAGCAWTATSNAGWIAVASSAGSGPANVAFTVSPNTQVARTGTITAAGVAINISQVSPSSVSPPPPSCTLALQPTSRSIAATATTGISVAVSAAAGCAWTSTSNATWLTITSGASGSGNGTVVMNAAANTGLARVGTVTIGGQTFTVNQAAAASPCVYSIGPTSQSVSAAGTTGLTVNVSTSAGCTWTATSNATWLTITSGASGSGNGSVRLNVAANAGAARSGTVTIAGQTFTVNQAAATAACTYSINPTALTVGDDNVSNLTVAVTAATGCTWSATSHVGWLDIDSGSSGSGNGTVTYDVDDYSGNSSRTGTMTIAGLTFTVTQVRCSTTLTPQTQSVSALGGSFTVSVATQLGCDWQAIESLNWVMLSGDTSGTGNGTVNYTVVPNVAGSRSGTIAIGGTTLTINQSGVIP
jgi:hypothetical protein